MYGRSYWGMTQWLTARLKPSHLVAIVPQHMNPDVYELVYRNHGALNLAMTAPSRAIRDGEAGDRYGWEKALMHLPLIDMDEVVSGERNELWRDLEPPSMRLRSCSTRAKYTNTRLFWHRRAMCS